MGKVFADIGEESKIVETELNIDEVNKIKDILSFLERPVKMYVGIRQC